MEVERANPLPRVLLACIALSILTLPLVLLQKIAVGGSQFSISYLFIAIILGWLALTAFARMPRTLDVPVTIGSLLPGLYLLLVIGSTAINGVDSAFLLSAIFWVAFVYLGMCLDSELGDRIATLLYRLGIFASVLGIVLYAINFPLLDLESLDSDMYFVNDWGHYRAASIFLNPNSFGYFLLFGFCAYCFGRTKADKWAALGAVICFTAFFLTGSRSAMVALALLLVLAVVRSASPPARFIWSMTVNLALVAILTIAVMLSRAFVETDIRFEKWDFSLELFFKSTEYWWRGLPSTVPLEKLGVFFSDNMFLTVLFRLGVPGFLMFLAFYGLILVRASQVVAWAGPVRRVHAAFVIVSTVLWFYSNFLYFYPLVLMHGIAVGQVLRADRFADAGKFKAKVGQ